jgi:hypothetical protein
MLPVIILNFHRVWKHGFYKPTFYIKAIVIFYILICISQFWGAFIKLGQPMEIGLIVARKYLLLFSYFFLLAVKASEEECYRFLKYLAWLGFCLSILLISDKILGGGIIFTQYSSTGQIATRAGELRLALGDFVIVFSIIYSFLKVMNINRQNIEKAMYFLVALVGLLAVFYVILTRAVILGIFLTFFFWLTYKVNSKKIKILCVALMVVLSVSLSGFFENYFQKSFFSKILDSTKTEIVSITGNVGIRIDALKYYIDLMLNKSPVVGIGTFSDTRYPNNPVSIAAETYSYRPIDINGFSTTIYFGLFGTLILVVFAVKTIRDSFKLIYVSNFPGNYNFQVILLILIYTLFTPTLNNLIVERMLIYSGLFIYLLDTSIKKYQRA